MSDTHISEKAPDLRTERFLQVELGDRRGIRFFTSNIHKRVNAYGPEALMKAIGSSSSASVNIIGREMYDSH
jgi:hypothetical protein